jgi:hypothetical protein
MINLLLSVKLYAYHLKRWVFLFFFGCIGGQLNAQTSEQARDWTVGLLYGVSQGALIGDRLMCAEGNEAFLTVRKKDLNQYSMLLSAASRSGIQAYVDSVAGSEVRFGAIIRYKNSSGLVLPDFASLVIKPGNKKFCVESVKGTYVTNILTNLLEEELNKSAGRDAAKEVWK